MEGPATATECAEVAGLSPSACSYHLRLLARYGFAEESDAPADGRTDRRERVWRATTRGWQSDLLGADVDEREAWAVDRALAEALLASSDERVLGWTERSNEETRDWREAALISNSTIVATAGELAEISERLMEALSPYLARARSPQSTPAEARLVHVALRLVPRTR